MSSRVYDHRPLGHSHGAPPSAAPLNNSLPPLGLGPPPLPSQQQQQQQQQPSTSSIIQLQPQQPPPQSTRLNEILDYVRAEFDSVVSEGSNLRAQREEYEAMINHHANELNAMRSIAYDLERKHHEDRLILQEENNRLEDEVVRLRREVSSSRSVNSNGGGNNSNNNNNNNSSSSHSHTRPNLPSLDSQQQQQRPGSSSSSSVPQVGHGPSNLFGSSGERERDYSYSNGGGDRGVVGPPMREREREPPHLDHPPSKRQRQDDNSSTGLHPPPPPPQSLPSPQPLPQTSAATAISNSDRFTEIHHQPTPPPPTLSSMKTKPPLPSTSYSKPSTPLPISSSSRPSSTGPLNSSTNHYPPSSSNNGHHSPRPPPPLAPTLHHPSPLPPPSLPPTIPLRENASPAPIPPPAATLAITTAVSEGGNGSTEFDPESIPRDLKKEGSDWMTMFNPNVKRVLDVGLVHTLVHDSVVCCVKFSPDGKILATGCNRNTTLYDTKTGAKISVFIDESVGIKTDNYVRSTSFSPDGKLLATGSEDRIIRIWNIAQKRISKIFQGHKSEIYSLAFSPDGRKLVSGSGDKTARMWDMETGSCLLTLPIDDISSAETGNVDAGVTSVVMSPDGKFLAAGSLDTVVRIWDTTTGQLLDKLKGHKDSVYSVAFSPDGKYLVSGSLDRTLKMWDMASLRNALASGKEPENGTKTICLTTLQGHKDYVLSVDISPDGAWIVSGSKDRGVQFWDPMTAKAQFMLQGHKNSVISVAVSQAAGNLVATGSGDWSARIWSYEQV